MNIIIFYLIGIPSGFILYLLGFKCRLFSTEDIIFYRGLEILIVTFIIQWIVSALIIFYFNKTGVNIANAFAVAVASFALNVTFLVIIPVTLDRSVSVFLLGYMNRENHALTKDELQNVLQTIYVEKYGAVERRIDEQIKSGNLSLDLNGNVVLSDRGKRFIFISKKIANLLDIDPKFVDPQ